MSGTLANGVIVSIVGILILIALYLATVAQIGSWRQGRQLLNNTTGVPELLAQLHVDLKTMSEKLDTRGQQIEAMQATIGTIHADTNHAFESVKGELVVAKDELVELKRQVTALIPEKKP